MKAEISLPMDTETATEKLCCLIKSAADRHDALADIAEQVGLKICPDDSADDSDGHDAALATAAHGNIWQDPPHQILLQDFTSDIKASPARYGEQQLIAIVDLEDQKMVNDAIIAGATHLHPQIINPLLLKAQLQMAMAALGSHFASADIDPVSGVYGDQYMRDLIGAWAMQDHNGPVYGMLLGLRRLDAVNATFGAQAGDLVLANTGSRLLAMALESMAAKNTAQYQVGRLSGSKFLLLCQCDQDRAAMSQLAHNMLARIGQDMMIGGHPMRVTARAALAVLKPGEDHLSFIDRLASGLSQIHQKQAVDMQWADRESDNNPENGYQLERDIIHATARDEIKILFQPQFSVADNRLTGAEALARWQHPMLGEINAGTLFAIAEKADFSRQLSTHIRKKALALAASWPRELADIRLSINLTARDISAPEFVADEIRRVTQSGFPANRLTLEITESALVPNLKKAANIFGQLRDQGLAIAVDDFGTGYSNMLYLKELPLDYLKLDHAMTRDISGEPRDRIIVRSMIALGRALSLDIIAEGVETEDQRIALAKEGCDYYQGFLKSAALAPDDFIRFTTRFK